MPRNFCHSSIYIIIAAMQTWDTYICLRMRRSFLEKPCTKLVPLIDVTYLGLRYQSLQHKKHMCWTNVMCDFRMPSQMSKSSCNGYAGHVLNANIIGRMNENRCVWFVIWKPVTFDWKRDSCHLRHVNKLSFWLVFFVITFGK